MTLRKPRQSSSTWSTKEMIMNIKVKIHPTLGFKLASNGMVWMPKRGRFRVPQWHWTFGGLKASGYSQVGRNGKTYLVHRLIAETFLENPNGYPFVDHISRDISDNNVYNLRFCTPHQNQMNRCDNRGPNGKKEYMREYNRRRRAEKLDWYHRKRAEGYRYIRTENGKRKWIKTEN